MSMSVGINCFQAGAFPWLIGRMSKLVELVTVNTCWLIDWPGAWALFSQGNIENKLQHRKETRPGLDLLQSFSRYQNVVLSLESVTPAAEKCREATSNLLTDVLMSAL